MIILSLLAILVVTGLVKYALHMLHMESYVKHLYILPPVYPIFGNSLQLIGKSTKDLFKIIVDSIKANDTPIKAYLGPILVVAIDRPDDFKTILMSPNCLDKPYFYEFYPSKVGLMSATCEFNFSIRNV